jgi:hypothetical protein
MLGTNLNETRSTSNFELTPDENILDFMYYELEVSVTYEEFCCRPNPNPKLPYPIKSCVWLVKRLRDEELITTDVLPFLVIEYAFMVSRVVYLGTNHLENQKPLGRAGTGKSKPLTHAG